MNDSRMSLPLESDFFTIRGDNNTCENQRGSSWKKWRRIPRNRELRSNDLKPKIINNNKEPRLQNGHATKPQTQKKTLSKIDSDLALKI